VVLDREGERRQDDEADGGLQGEQSEAAHRPGDYRLGSTYPTDCDYDPAIGRQSITLG
jgi:hypothetical protein